MLHKSWFELNIPCTSILAFNAVNKCIVLTFRETIESDHRCRPRIRFQTYSAIFVFFMFTEFLRNIYCWLLEFWSECFSLLVCYRYRIFAILPPSTDVLTYLFTYLLSDVIICIWGVLHVWIVGRAQSECIKDRWCHFLRLLNSELNYSCYVLLPYLFAVPSVCWILKKTFQLHSYPSTAIRSTTSDVNHGANSCSYSGVV